MKTPVMENTNAGAVAGRRAGKWAHYTRLLLWFTAGLLMTRAARAQSRSFTLNGQMANLPDGEVYLGFGTFGSMKADTVTAKDGKFSFTDKIGEPCFAMLFNHDYSLKVDLYLDGGTITVNGDLNAIYDVERFMAIMAVTEQAVESKQPPPAKPFQQKAG